MKKITTIGILSILILSVFSIFLPFKNCKAAETNILYVGGIGNANFSKIQEAINASSPGNIVYVYNGKYSENIVINKSISLIGEDRNNTIIDGNGYGDIISISADNANVTGFTIQNSGINKWMDAGIDVESNYTGLYRNFIKNCSNGITLDNSSTTEIINNALFSCGISIWGDTLSQWNSHNINNNFVNNKPIYYFKNIQSISVPSDAGQVILANCSHCLIQNLIIFDSDVGIQLGFSLYNNISSNDITNVSWGSLYLFKSTNNTLYNNTFLNSEHVEIMLNELCTDNTISYNTIINATCPGPGLDLINSNKNIVEKNIFKNNKCSGILLIHSNENIIQENNFTDNCRGIRLKDNSSKNVILKNDFLNNYEGIFIEYSIENEINNNFFTSSGLYILGSSIDQWNSHTIENNSLNGKTIYYYKNRQDNITVPYSAGQVILANCSRFLIQNLTITNVTVGIQLGFSSDNTITSNNIANSYYGICLWDYSNNNTVYRNTLVNNEFGIHPARSLNNSYYDNVFEGNHVNIRGEYTVPTLNQSHLEFFIILLIEVLTLCIVALIFFWKRKKQVKM
ncbi:MAG: right-handed parallel beta-helix repeat-containing protein [Euryarchaeota archaeon]|nr:right-handed parallel beta-helix repeat-containing protein [Euryarchaeota archaeon]